MAELIENIWHLRFQADPFVQSQARLRFKTGVSIMDAVADLGADDVEIFVDGHSIPAGIWRMVRPKAGTVFEARAVPGGFVAPVVAAVSGFLSTTAIAGITWGQIAGVAFSFALQALSSSLFAPKTPSYESDESDPVYSISGARNSMNPWAAVPIVYGTHRFTPPHGASPYTEVDGAGDQYLRVVLVWGYGPVDVGDIRIGTTPLDEFDDVTIEHDLDGTGSLTLYPFDVSQESIDVEISAEGESLLTRYTDGAVKEAWCTCAFPGGLIRYRDSDGYTKKHTKRVVGQYRLAGSSDPWTLFFNHLFEEETTDPIFFAANVIFPTNDEYEVSWWHSGDGDGDNTYVDDVHWLNMKSVSYEDPINAPGIAKTAIRIKATDQLNGVIDQLNGLVSRKIPNWDGTDWDTVEATSNPAAVYRDVLRGAANARATTRTADAELAAWHEHCTNWYLTYNNVIQSQRPVSDMLSEVAAAGFASPRLTGDQWGVVVDTYRDTVVQHFTPRNTWGFGGAIPFPELPHAVRVQYSNVRVDFEADELIVYDDGYDAATATKFEVIRPAGVTTWEGAYRFGRHFIASAKLRPEQFSFSADFENLVAERGDLVRVTHDVPMIGQCSGRVADVSGTTVTLDEPLTVEGGVDYVLRVRTAADVSVTPTVSSVAADGLSVVVSDATGISAGDLYTFGELETESEVCLIHSIEPGDDLSARLTCIPYRSAIYEAWDEIPDYESVVSSPVSAATRGPATPEILWVKSDESALPSDMQGNAIPHILIQISAGSGVPSNPRVTQAEYLRLGWRKAGDERYEYMTLQPATNRVYIPNVKTGVAYDISLMAVDKFGACSATVVLKSHIVSGLVAPPPTLDTFRVTTNGPSAFLEWTYTSIVGDVVGYEIRWHPDSTVTDWSTMMIVATDIPRDSRSHMVPARTGVYAIKAIDTLGLRSAAARFVKSTIVADSSSRIQITEFEYVAADGDFAGDFTGCYVVGNGLQLVNTGLVSSWPEISTLESLLRPSNDYPLSTDGYYEIYPPLQIFNEIHTGRLSWEAVISSANYRNLVKNWGSIAALGDLNGDATGDEYTVEMQVARSDTDISLFDPGADWDDIVYGDWEALTSGEYTARTYKFRMVLHTNDSAVSPVVESIKFRFDMERRTETGEDETSSTVTFADKFAATPNVSINGQDLLSGDYHRITSLGGAGFTVTFYNSGGSPVSRTFDWQATGYGRETA